jgi:hypothetical protein
VIKQSLNADFVTVSVSFQFGGSLKPKGTMACPCNLKVKCKSLVIVMFTDWSVKFSIDKGLKQNFHRSEF